MVTETARPPNQHVIKTKYGPIRLSAWGDKATIVVDDDPAYKDQLSDQPHIVINRIPYSFTMHLKHETQNYAGEPYPPEDCHWRIDGGGVYIRRLNTQYGLGEPTAGARTVIYNEIRDLAIAYLDNQPDFINEGRKAALLSAIEGYERDLTKLGDEMNAIHDKIREAREEWRGL